MQKSSVAIIVAAIAGIAIAPKIIGLSVIDSLNTHVAQINDIPAYTASVTEINSGWFSSSALIDVSLNVPNMDSSMQNAFTFKLNFSAQHGPILMGEQFGIGREAWQVSYQGESLREYLDFAADQAFYAFNAKTNLLGATKISDRIVPFNIETTEKNEQISVTFSGYQGNGDVHSDKINYLANIENVSLKGENQQGTIDDIQIDTHLEATLEQIFSGEMYNSLMKMTIASMDFEDNHNPALNSTIKNTVLSGESVSDKSKKLVHILSTYSVDSYEIMGSVGQDLKFNFDINNLSSDFIKAYQTQVQDVINPQQNTPEAVQQQLMEFMDKNLLDLLIASPEMNIPQFSGTIEQGKFNAQLFTKLVNITAMPTNMLDKTFWLNHIKASAHIELDQSVAEMIATQVVKSQLQGNPQMAQATPEELNEIAAQQAPIILQNLEQQGLLEATAAGYKLVAELADSQATLNGNPIPLPQ